MPRIVLLTDVSGDWMGVRVDGKIVYQGHSISPAELLRCVGVEFELEETDIEESGETYE